MTLFQKLCMSQYHNDDALPKKSVVNQLHCIQNY